MRIILLIFTLFISAGLLHSQSLFVNSVNYDNSPELSAKFYAFDENKDLLKNFSSSDLTVFEDGIQRNVISVNCPEAQPRKLSVTIVIDVSGSMGYNNRISAAKEAATMWIDKMPEDGSECSILSFDNEVYVNQSFTTDKELLKQKVDALKPKDATNYNKALLAKDHGAIDINKKGKYKRVIIFLTDGKPNKPLKTEEVKNKLFENDITFFGITLGGLYLPSLKDVSESSGGLYFPEILGNDELTKIFLVIKNIAENLSYCTVKWESDIFCGNPRKILLNINIGSVNAFYSKDYQYPDELFGYLEFEPKVVFFKNIDQGSSADTVITVKSHNVDFNLKNITSSDPDFEIFPKSGILSPQSTTDLTLTYTPSDNSFNKTDIKLITELCEFEYIAAGINYNDPSYSELNLIEPNGGEKYLTGSDTAVKWEGILPESEVKIDYSTDNGSSWQNIGKGNNNKFDWKSIPDTPSDRCLMKIKTGAMNNTDYTIQNFGHLFNIKLSPDGNYVAAAGNGLYVWDYNSENKLIDSTYKLPNILTCLSFSPDGSKLAAGDNKGNFYILSFPELKIIKEYDDLMTSAGSITWSSDGSYIAFAGDYNLIVYDLLNNVQKLKKTGFTYGYNDVDFNYDDSFISVVEKDTYRVTIYDLEDGTVEQNISTDYALNVDWHPSKNLIVYRYSNRQINVFNFDLSSNVKKYYGGHLDVFKSPVWSPDGSYFAFGLEKIDNGYEYDLKVFDLEGDSVIAVSNDANALIGEFYWHASGNELLYLEDHTNRIKKVDPFDKKIDLITDSPAYGNFQVKWHPNGEFLAFNDKWSNEIKVGVPVSNEIFTNIPASINDVNTVEWSPSGDRLAVGGRADRVVVYDFQSGNELNNFTGFTDMVEILTWSPDGKRLAGFTSDHARILFWDTHNIGGTPNIKKTSFYSSVDLEWHPDGEIITAAGEYRSSNQVINYESVFTNNKIAEKDYQNKMISEIKWSPDGKYLAVALQNGTLEILDKDLQIVKSEKVVFGGYLRSVCWSPDGKELLCSNKKKLIVIELNSLEVKEQYHGHRANVVDAAWQPNNKGMAGVDIYGNLLYWQIKNIPVLRDTSDAVWSIVSPDIAAGSIDMRTEFVNETKDSVINEFIINSSSFDVTIDSVKIEGRDAADFSLVNDVSGANIKAGEKLDVEFRFQPQAAGQRASNVIIYFGAKKKTYDIKGIGIEKKLISENTFIDFGTLQKGESKDSTFEELIKNVNPLPVEIIVMKIENIVPNSYAFTADQPDKNIDIDANSAVDIGLRFNALETGIITGKLKIIYENEYLSYEIPVYGEVIDTLKNLELKIHDHSAPAGRIAGIPVILKGARNYAEGTKDSISFTLSYNATLLDPLEQPRGIIENGKRIINYELPMQVSQDSILTELFFRTALGNDSLTTLDLSNISVNTDQKIDTAGGNFKLLDICREGGSRLIRSRLDDAGITGIIPNPASMEVEIELNIIEEGTTKLYLRNSIGQLVKEADISHLKPGVHDFKMELSGLGTGLYLLQLSTPGIIQSKKLIVK